MTVVYVGRVRERHLRILRYCITTPSALRARAWFRASGLLPVSARWLPGQLCEGNELRQSQSIVSLHRPKVGCRRRVGSHQHRGTLRDTMSPSCKAIMLIEHDLAQQTQFSYLVLSHALQLKLHSRRNEDKYVDYIKRSFFEAYGIGHGWRKEIGLPGTYTKISFPRKFRFNT